MRSYDQNAINEEALKCKTGGYISTELYDSVKNLCFKRLNSSPMRDDWKEGASIEALHEALGYFEYGRGNFTYVLQNALGRIIFLYDRQIAPVVHKTLTPDSHVDKRGVAAKDKKHIITYPSDYEASQDSPMDCDSVYGSCEQSVDWEEDDELALIRAAVAETLTDEEKEIYDWHFIYGNTLSDYAETMGISRQAVQAKSKAIQAKIKGYVSRYQIRESLKKVKKSTI